MDAVTYSYTRQHFSDMMDRVNEDRVPLLVTRQKGRPVVMISLDDHNSMEETAYLLRSPSNARRLIDSVDELRRTGGKEHELAADAD